jgi:hypothetical protein
MFFSEVCTKSELGPKQKSYHFDDEMKTKFHTVGTIPDSNIKHKHKKRK